MAYKEESMTEHDHFPGRKHRLQGSSYVSRRRSRDVRANAKALATNEAATIARTTAKPLQQKLLITMLLAVAIGVLWLMLR